MEPHPNDPAYQDGVTLLALIRVGGVQVPVYLKPAPIDSSDDTTVGMANYQPYTHIIIDNSIHPQLRAQTLFHELLHVISDSYGPSLKEAQVLCLEQGFTQILQDNPKEMAWVLNTMAKAFIPEPILDGLEEGEQEEAVKNTIPSINDRGENLN